MKPKGEGLRHLIAEINRERVLPVVFGVLMVGTASAASAVPVSGYAGLSSWFPGCVCERHEYPPGSKIKRCVKWRCAWKVPTPFPPGF